MACVCLRYSGPNLGPPTVRWQRGPAAGSLAALASEVMFFGRLDAPHLGDGGPVAVWRLGLVDFAGIAREGLGPACTDCFVSHLEELLQCGRAASLAKGELVRSRLIIDGTGLGLDFLRSKQFLFKKKTRKM